MWELLFYAESKFGFSDLIKQGLDLSPKLGTCYMNRNDERVSVKPTSFEMISRFYWNSPGVCIKYIPLIEKPGRINAPAFIYSTI